MPRWYYIQGCPCPAECNKHKTTVKTKTLKWWGSCAEDVIDQVVHHLTTSTLHKMPKANARELVLNQVMETYEDDEDEDNANDKNTGSREKRKRADSDDDEDPLVTDISRRVSNLVGKNLQQLALPCPPSRASSSSDSPMPRNEPNIHAAKLAVESAEVAARKAQAISLQAAAAFGEIAKKFRDAYEAMD